MHGGRGRLRLRRSVFGQRLGVAILQIEALHVHEHTPVDRRVGSREDPDHLKGIVHLAVVGAVRGGEVITDLQPEVRRHGGAEHAAEEVLVAEVAAA